MKGCLRCGKILTKKNYDNTFCEVDGFGMPRWRCKDCKIIIEAEFTTPKKEGDYPLTAGKPFDKI